MYTTNELMMYRSYQYSLQSLKPFIALGAGFMVDQNTLLEAIHKETIGNFRG